MIGIVSPVPTEIMLPKWQLCWLNTTERKERKKKTLIENIPLSSAVSTTPRQHVKLMTLAGLWVCYLIWLTDDASQCSLLTSRNTLMLKASPAPPRGPGSNLECTPGYKSPHTAEQTMAPITRRAHLINKQSTNVKSTFCNPHRDNVNTVTNAASFCTHSEESR